MDGVFDIIVAYFAVIGIIAVTWWIIELIYSAKRGGLRGTYLYIPADDEDEADAAEIFGELTEGKHGTFTGSVVILCSDEYETDSVISEICKNFGRIYKYEAGYIEIRKRCDGNDNDRGDN